MKQSEKAEQQGIVNLLRSLGAKVYVLGTRRRGSDYQGTCQTPGLPDLVAFLPARGTHQPRAIAIECKAPGGRLRPEQAEFRAWCLASGVTHITGGLDAVIAWLIAEHYLKSSQVAHFHTAQLS